MKAVFILAIVAVAFAAETTFDEAFADEISFVQDEPAGTLASAVSELRSAAPELLQAHVDHIAKHAELIQSKSSLESEKAKAYAHNFAASQRAIKNALKSLTDQLQAGHRHDKAALSTARANAGNLLASVIAKSKTAVRNYRGKACPSKRAEEAANAKKAAAKAKLDKEKNTKICTLATSWGDMDIDKSSPKFGAVLRNGWDAARAKWLAAKAKHDAAIKAHNTAIANHNKAMASFTTAVKLEATNTRTQCSNGHKEYNILKNEVASNVRTRKATFIATLVIACYIDHVASNSRAKTCAEKQRKASVSQWNITPTALAGCTSTATLQHRYGPLSWKPTTSACGIHTHCPAEPSVNRNGFQTAVSGFKAVGCGDCDHTYTNFGGRSKIGLAKCAAECKRVGCKRFSYGEKRHDGNSALGCRISKSGKKCPNSITRYCAKSYNPTWTGAEGKHCCSTASRCGKINHWGGVMYEPK